MFLYAVKSSEKSVAGEIRKDDTETNQNGGATPSLKEIAKNIGFAESTVSKYLKVMREKVIVECEGRKNIITKQSRRDAEGFCRVPVLGAIACGIPKLAEENIEEYIGRSIQHTYRLHDLALEEIVAPPQNENNVME